MTAKIETGSDEKPKSSSYTGRAAPLQFSNDGENWVTIGTGDFTITFDEAVDVDSTAQIAIKDECVLWFVGCDVSALVKTESVNHRALESLRGIRNHPSVIIQDDASESVADKVNAMLDKFQGSTGLDGKDIVVIGPGHRGSGKVGALMQYLDEQIAYYARQSFSLVALEHAKHLSSSGGRFTGKGKSARRKNHRKMFGGW